MRIGIETFQKQNKLVRQGQNQLATQKRLLKSYCSEDWAIFFTDEGMAQNDVDVVLQTDIEDTMDTVCGQRATEIETKMVLIIKIRNRQF